MRLPKIPYVMNKNKSQVVPLGNINFCAATSDGDLVDSCGISARKYPYMTTSRGKIGHEIWRDGAKDEDARVVDFYFWNYRNVYVIEWPEDPAGTAWLYLGSDEDGLETCVGKTLGCKKQFIPINTKLVILPDKVYLDSTDWTLHKLEAQIVDHMTVTKGSAGNNCTIYADRSNFHDQRMAFRTYGKFEGNKFINYARTEFIEEQIVVRNEYGTEFTPVEHAAYGRFVFMKEETSGDGITPQYLYTFVESEKTDNTANYFSKDDQIYFEKEGGLFSACCKVLYSSTDEENRYSYAFDSAELASEDNVHIYKKGEFSFLSTYRKNERYYFSDGQLHYSHPLSGSYIKTCSGQLISTTSTIDEIEKYISALQIYTLSESDVWPDNVIDDGLYFETSGPNSGYVTFCSDIIGSNLEIYGNFLPDEDLREVDIWHIVDQDLESWQYINLTDYFKVGDTVIARSESPSFGEKTFTITALTPSSMSTSADIFPPGTYSDMTIERRFPDLDFACECHNRLFGCSNADKTIYVSALGDPTNMMTYEGVSTDAFAVAVAGEGDFTACCAHDSSVLFWKENKLHKLTGYTPADFALYTYQVDGVQAGSEASAQIINEVLYYKGVNGVFAYTGGIPQLISQNFREREFHSAVGGSDGDTYYISMTDSEGKDYMFAYETRSNLWVLEDGIKCDAFVRSNGSLKYLSGGKVYELTSGETPREHEWFMHLAPMYETMEGKKTYSRILLRVELPIGSYIVASVRMDGGRWLETGRIVGKTNNVVPIRIPVNRCDKFELKLTGRGPCTILGIMREYYVGGDV